MRGIAHAAPVVELDVGIPSRPGNRLPLLGIDPLEEASVRSFADFVPGSRNLEQLIAEPNTVLLPESLAAELASPAGSVSS